MKFLFLLLFLISCTPRYTVWTDSFNELERLKRELSVENEIIEIIPHKNGIFKIIYKDRKEPKCEF